MLRGRGKGTLPKPFKFLQQKKTLPPLLKEKDERPLSHSIEENEQTLQSIYAHCYDVVFRSFYIGGERKALLIYIEGLVDVSEMDDNMLSPLMEASALEFPEVVDLIEKKVSVGSVQEVNTFSDCISEVSSGNSLVLIDGTPKAISVGLTKWESRSITESDAEIVVRGPREGFIETIHVNTSMLRRRIRSPKFKLKTMEIGKYTKTQVILGYIEGIAQENLIKEVENRVQRIDVDGLIDSGELEEFIQDANYSPFPQVLSTERPDVATANLLEGRVILIVDGSPFVLVMPVTFFSFLQIAEDYYARFMIGTLIRWLRYTFLFISLLLPSIYVALFTFHQEMIPTDLLISVASAREQTPFPALVEALLMEVTFEALREAGLRLPKQVGAAVSIVGALVIGEAAVQASIVSAPMVIVVALTGIASFTIPRYPVSISIRVLRFPMIFLAGTLGLLGVIFGIIAIVIHLCTIRSFGVPYLSPIAPLHGDELKDVLIRAPWWTLNKRPHLTGERNTFRQSPNQQQSPEKGG